MVGRENELFQAIAETRLKYKIWWLLVYVNPETGALEYKDYPSSAFEHLSRLSKMVKELRKKGASHYGFAIWHGSHRTDAFLVVDEELLRRVEEWRRKLGRALT